MFEQGVQQLLVCSQAASTSDSDAPASPSAGRPRRALHSDGTRASAAASELEIAAALAAAAGRAPAGRFSGREGKLARIRAQEAAFAALRGAANTAGSAADGTPCADAARATNSSDSSCETAVQAAAAGAGAGGSRPQKSKAAGATAPGSADAPDASSMQQPKKRRRREGAGGVEAGGSKRRRRAGACLEAGAAGPGRSHEAPSAEGASPLSAKLSRKAAAVGSPAVVDARSLPDVTPGSAGGAADGTAADADPLTGRDSVAQNPAAGAWWGAGRFVSAGCLEGLGREPAAVRERRAFDEDDQAGLYMAAHAAKTANKKGLGTRAVLSAPLPLVWYITVSPCPFRMVVCNA